MVFLGLPIRGTELEQKIQATEFDLTDVVLAMLAQKIQWPLDTVTARYERYDIEMENLSAEPDSIPNP